MLNDEVMPKMKINNGEFSKLNWKVKVKWWQGMVNSFHLVGKYDATCHFKKNWRLHVHLSEIINQK